MSDEKTIAEMPQSAFGDFSIGLMPLGRHPWEVFEGQVEYNPAARTYTARCGVCGKIQTLKKTLFFSRDRTLEKLRMPFNFCETCGKWVCEDCYLIDDGNGNGIGICTACAKERGRTGLTSAQLDEAWPDLQKRIWACGLRSRDIR